MLHDLLRRYLQGVENSIQDLESAYVERYQEEILTANRVNLRIRIRLANGNLLELDEAIIADTEEVKHLAYRYHCQDRAKQLIFRYDNTPHFPKLDSFPHHKHPGNKIIACEKPSIPQAIEEARSIQSW